MAKERKETFRPSRRFPRRTFLRGLGVLGGTAVISAVGLEANKALKGDGNSNEALQENKALDTKEQPQDLSDKIVEVSPKTETADPRPEIEDLSDVGVTESNRLLIRNEVDYALDYFHNFFGKYPQAPISLINFESTANARKAGLGGIANSGRQANRGFLMIDTASQGWIQNTETFNRKIVAHETMHQYQLDYFKRLAVDKPWIDEGMAEYSGYAAIIEQGLITFEDAKNRNVLLLKSGNNLGSLASLSKDDQGPKYALFYLAVNRLLGQDGMSKIAQYYKNLQGGSNQADTFKNVFGVSIESFEVDFEKYRKTI